MGYYNESNSEVRSENIFSCWDFLTVSHTYNFVAAFLPCHSMNFLKSDCYQLLEYKRLQGFVCVRGRNEGKDGE